MVRLHARRTTANASASTGDVATGRQRHIPAGGLGRPSNRGGPTVMTDTEALIMKQDPRPRRRRLLLISVTLIGAALVVASFMMDWSASPNSNIQSATSAQKSRLPQLHMRF